MPEALEMMISKRQTVNNFFFSSQCSTVIYLGIPWIESHETLKPFNFVIQNVYKEGEKHQKSVCHGDWIYVWLHF